MTTNQPNNISTKLCIYGCGQNLYFNTAVNEYWELFNRKKHLCPNRQQQQQSKPIGSTSTTTTTTRPNYYNKFTKQPKPKMSNSLELLTGSIDSVQKMYEILSDIVIVEYNGKVHGSQSHNLVNNLLALVVYYEIPEGKREEVKTRFKNSIIVLHNR